MPTPAPQLQLFYDPACPLCRRFQQLIRHWDRHGTIQLLPLDTPDLADRFPDFDAAASRAQLTVRDAQGRWHRGENALQRLAAVLPGLRRLGWIWRLPGMQGALRRTYATAQRRRACRHCGHKWMPSDQRRRPKGNRP